MLNAIEARFVFADGPSFDTRGGKVRQRVSVGEDGIPAELRIDVVEASETTVHLVVLVTNLGAVHKGNLKPANLHPSYIGVTFPKLGEVVGVFGEDHQQDASRGVTLSSGWHFGVRDANMRGVGRVSVGESHATAVVLETIPSTIRPWCAEWKQELGGHPGEDPLSRDFPTLPGGSQMVCHVIASKDRARIDEDPMPFISPEMEEDFYLEDVRRNARAPRHQELVESLAKVGYRFDEHGRFCWTDGGTGGFPFWFTQRERRWETWDRDRETDLFDPPEGGQDSLHFLAWPDVWWSDGHTNCHYGFAYSAWRAFLYARRVDPQGQDTRVLWWLASRLIEYANTTGLCHSEGDRYDGWAWYEKSVRGPTGAYPGAMPNYAAARYKQHGSFNAIAGAHHPHAHVREGAERNIAAQMTLGTEDRGVEYGSRGAAWGLIGAVELYRIRRIDAWRDLAQARARKLMDSANQGQKSDRGDDTAPIWWNFEQRDDRTNVFEIAKAIFALFRYRRSPACVEAESELLLIDDFLHRAVDRFLGYVEETPAGVLFEYQTTPDKARAIYARKHRVHCPDRSTFTRVYGALVLGEAAKHFSGDPIALRSDMAAGCRTLFLKLFSTLGDFLDAKRRPEIVLTQGEYQPARGKDSDSRRIIDRVDVSTYTPNSGRFDWQNRAGWDGIKNEAQLLLWGDLLADTAARLRRVEDAPAGRPTFGGTE